MKKYNKIIISGFIMAVLFSFLGFNAKSQDISEKTVRLHVLANSNSEYDQRIKLVVKDEVSAVANEIVNSASSVKEAEKLLDENLIRIENAANLQLSQLKAGYTARAVVEKDYFGTREYEDFTMPAGEYMALRVLLGEGQGKNWWCVVYPAICFSAAAKDFDELTGGENELIKSETKVNFKVYEWYLDLRRMLAGK